MKDKKTIALIIPATLAAAPTASCSDQGPEPAVSAKAMQVNLPECTKTDNPGNDTGPVESRTVTTGTADTGEPYSVADDQGNWTEAEADLWVEIETCIGRTIEMKQIPDIASLFRELNTGRVDVTANCLATAEARLKTYIASDPICVDAQVIMIRPDSKYKTLDDLRGHTIGVTAGQAAQPTVENMIPDHD